MTKIDQTNQTAKFTPGPWQVAGQRHQQETKKEYEEAGLLDRELTRVHCGVGTGSYVDVCAIDKKESIANTRLIAAAPEMYEALKDLIFTASSLWDKIKPIKDTNILTVTHPIIEHAKYVLSLVNHQNPSL